MIGALNSLNLNRQVRVMKEAPGPSVSEEIGDIFRNYNIDDYSHNNDANNDNNENNDDKNGSDSMQITL